MSACFSIALLCKIAGVSRSEYYKWLKNGKNLSKKQVENQALQKKIVEIFNQYRGIFGYRRITVWLRKILKRTYRLMKVLGI
ncbi:IS3 family transposase [Domibacillus aminovorans]|uniref:IS3 family transposase n=1 Tax=Domibacillus aminovorans TaxID=29332 RepID=UPI000B9D53BA